MGFMDDIRRIAEIGLERQEIHDGDTYNDEGLLKCGVCGELRQEYVQYKDGKLLTVRECKCDRFRHAEEEKKKREKFAQDRINEIASRSGIPYSFKECTFDNWRITDSNKKNHRLCKSYAERFDEMLAKNQGLLFWGDTGTGKTWASACIANFVIHQAKSVAFLSAIQIVEDDERINNARLLIIDDLGAERQTEFAAERLMRAIDDRYNQKKPMIITTNLTLKKMAEETDIRYRRMYDRINEICYPMQFTGNSMRKEAGMKRMREMEEILGA